MGQWAGRGCSGGPPALSLVFYWGCRLRGSSGTRPRGLGFECCLGPGPPAAWPALALLTYSQGLDGLQRGKEPLADGLKLVVIQGEQAEALQVLERVHPQAVDLVGIEQAADRREAPDVLSLVRPAEQGRGCRPPGTLLTARAPPPRERGDLQASGHRISYHTRALVAVHHVWRTDPLSLPRTHALARRLEVTPRVLHFLL